MSRDIIGDFLTIIRNGFMVKKRFVELPLSKFKVNIVNALKEEGYVKDYSVEEHSGKFFLKIMLKYVNGESVIHEIKRVSKPSRRYYERKKNVTSVIGGLGVSILTTNLGIITDRQAKKLNVGGEVICHVW